MMKEICIFSAFYNPHIGGVERYVEQLSKQLNLKGYKINVITSNYSNLEKLDVINHIYVYRVPSKLYINGRFPVYKINKEIYQEVYDIVNRCDQVILNARFYPISLLGARISKKCKKKVFLIEHGSGILELSNKFMQFLINFYVRMITLFVKRYVKDFYGVSKKSSEWLQNFGINSKGELHNSIDVSYEIVEYTNTKEKFNLPKESKIISFVGRLLPEKGVLLLIEAFLKVNKEYKGVYLFIAGDGELLDSLQKQYSGNSNIKILGALPYNSIMNLLKDTDIFVLPSMMTEGMPTTILEAAINNTAIIATPKGGTIEVILDKDYGVIVEENSVESIENAIKKCLDDGEYCDKISSNVYNHVKQDFNWEVLANKIIQIIERN